MARAQRWLLVAATILFCSSGAAASLQTFRTVVIDAGHGGHDRGGIPGQRVSEKVVALDTAKRLEQILRRSGFKTVMTRKSDYFVPLGTRVSMASKYRDAIFVSVHYNSAEREGARGYETFYYNSASRPLAANILGNLLRVQRTENRGVKQRGFYVLRTNRLPSVLVECGFLTNKKEAKLAQSSRYRQAVAEAIARGIIQTRRGR